MADEDDIDILGDFSFNSCLAQNTQGIPSCSDREDTIHPQWLLDSTENNWYDIKSKGLNRLNDGSSRKLSGNSSIDNYDMSCTTWTAAEKRVLYSEMEKYGRNIQKISQKIKTKSEAEIQALIEAEYGINLEMPLMGLEKLEDEDCIPAVVQEEIVTEEIPNLKSAINLVTTGTATVTLPKRPYHRKTNSTKFERNKKCDIIKINPSQLLYEDDIILGSTESIGTEYDTLDIVSESLAKIHKDKVRVEKKLGNHRRKPSRIRSKSTSTSKSKDVFGSPGRQRKDSNKLSDIKSPKMQIVLGSGWALPVSEGEQVIKIEKKNDIESESDVEVDIDSDNDIPGPKIQEVQEEIKQIPKEVPLPMPHRKFEPMPKRKKKINLDGEGGYTIMHTDSGDLFEIASEPRKERQPKKSTINLLQCRVYNVDKPAPYEVCLFVSTLISMDVHAHTSRGEVMGLLGGSLEGSTVTFQAYRRAVAASGSTHCDMDPVSQSAASEWLLNLGVQVCGWHHSHPQFPAAPSAVDLRSQRALQAALGRARRPFLAVITSQHWAPGRAQSQYRCFRVEDDGVGDSEDLPAGYQLSMKLVADVTQDNLPQLTQQLQDVICDNDPGEYSVDMLTDKCPQAGMTYLEKCISSVSHHMRSAGYSDDDSVVKQLIEGIRDVFR